VRLSTLRLSILRLSTLGEPHGFPLRLGIFHMEFGNQAMDRFALPWPNSLLPSMIPALP